MDGMSNNQEEICEIISVRGLLDRVLEEKRNNKGCVRELKPWPAITMWNGRPVLQKLD